MSTTSAATISSSLSASPSSKPALSRPPATMTTLTLDNVEEKEAVLPSLLSLRIAEVTRVGEEKNEQEGKKKYFDQFTKNSD